MKSKITDLKSDDPINPNPILDLTEVMELMLDAVCVVDQLGVFVFVSAAFERIFGYHPDEVIGKLMLDFVYPEDVDNTIAKVDEIKSGNNQPSYENRWVHKSGRIVSVLWSARWSEQHQVRIAVAHDITDRKIMENQLKHMASHDSLTNLPNRTFVKDRLRDAIFYAEANQTRFCLLFMDINGFKQINDKYGHLIGDHVLSILAKRILNSVRETDVVGRLGGDEFLILLDSISQESELESFVNKMRSEIKKPLVLDKIVLEVSLSIGIARYPTNATSAVNLIHFADKAMYQDKKRMSL